MKSYYISLLSLTLLFSLFSSSIVVTGSSTNLFYSVMNTYKSDGIISKGEYPTLINIPDQRTGTIFTTLAWGHNLTHVFIGIMTIGTGFVGFGMNKVGQGMAGAEMIIASVTGGKIDINNYIGTGHVKPTLSSTQYQSLSSASGSIQKGNVTVEFILPMKGNQGTSSHDWKVGQTEGFFIAAHKTSTLITYHTWHSNLLSVKIEDKGVTPASPILSLKNNSPLIWGLVLISLTIMTSVRKKLLNKNRIN